MQLTAALSTKAKKQKIKINVNKNNQNLNVQDKGIHETGHNAILNMMFIFKRWKHA